jgi:hypothetical protein
MAAPTPVSSDNLIAGIYAVELGRPLAGAGGGLPAFAVTDRSGARSGLMAVQSAPGTLPRAIVLNALAGWKEEGLLAPLACGPGRGPQGEAAWFAVCPAPPGPSLASTLRPWSEAELLEFVLRPAAATLAALDQERVTHRAIRIDNIFRPGRGTPVVLGAAWSAPPAMHQSVLFEPPYSAMCLPAGRGEGSIADDVYALGVVLVALALGRLPLEGLDPLSILRRKLALGSFAALVGEDRLPSTIGDLVRGMLAEDPEHRPPPLLLADPAAARTRRVAARPPRRGQRPLEVAGDGVWDARSLAHALASDPAEGERLLHTGLVDRWLRRSLGDPTIAARLDEVLRLHAADSRVDGARADSLMMTRAVAALDPLAPLCWRGVILWPDGLGPALVAAAAMEGEQGAQLSERLADLVLNEAASHWAAMRPERGDPTLVRLESRQRRSLLQVRGWAGGLPRLRYALNPLAPCASPLFATRMVSRLQDLLGALEAASGRPEARGAWPVDREIAAFVAARNDLRSAAELTGMSDGAASEQAMLMQLRLLADLQRRIDGRPLPGLAGWLAEQSAPMLATWRNRSRRAALERAVHEAARSGQLGAMVAVMDNAAERAADALGFRAAGEAVRRIDGELAALAAGAGQRAEMARRVGQEAALGIALVAATVAVVAVVLG